jgi:2-C-methyl-D-erythritol 4-phosphate cytidylyltransferase
MKMAVVIVAAGRGLRVGAEIPKQYIPLGDTCALNRTVRKFLSIDAVNWIVPVIHPDDKELCSQALIGLHDERLLAAVRGAETRAKSVRCGLEKLARFTPDVVLIHDAARPFLPTEVIHEVVAALQLSDGACAALPLVDALWTSSEGFAQSSVQRDGLWRAQTPQGFVFSKILQAHRQHDGSGADDVTVAREAGLEVRFVMGSERNYKITTGEDLIRALADARSLDG